MDDVRSTDVGASRWRFMLCALQKWILSEVNETLRCNLLHNRPACLLSFCPCSRREALSFVSTEAYN